MRAKYQFIIILITITISSCGQTIGNKQKIAVDTTLLISTKQYSWEDTDRLDEYYGGTRKVNVQVWYPTNKVTSSNLRTPYLLFGKNFTISWKAGQKKIISQYKK